MIPALLFVRAASAQTGPACTAVRVSALSTSCGTNLLQVEFHNTAVEQDGTVEPRVVYAKAGALTDHQSGYPGWPRVYGHCAAGLDIAPGVAANVNLEAILVAGTTRYYLRVGTSYAYMYSSDANATYHGVSSYWPAFAADGSTVTSCSAPPPSSVVVSPPSPPTGPACIAGTPVIAVSSFQYTVDGTTNAFSVGSGPANFQVQTSGYHPVKFTHDGGNPACAVSVSTADPDLFLADGTHSVVFPSDPQCLGTTYSLTCRYHGVMGSASRVTLSATCVDQAPPTLSPPSPSPSPSPSPIHSPSPPAGSRSKILCLHGGGSSASDFNSGTSHIQQSMSQYEFVFVDAAEAGGLWVLDPPGGKDAPTTDPAVDLASYTLLDGVLQTQGPFVGIMGYSQGSMYSIAYMAHAPPGTFQFAVLFCGYLPETHLGIMSRINQATPFSVPAFVFMGANDATITNNQTHAQAAVFTNATVVVSATTAHTPPASTDSTYQQLVAWMSSPPVVALHPPSLHNPPIPVPPPPTHAPPPPPHPSIAVPPVAVPPVAVAAPPLPPVPVTTNHVVKFTIVVAGDAASFNHDAFKQSISILTGAPMSNIILNVTSGSVIVDTQVLTDSPSAANSAQAALAPAFSNSSAASELLGVQVESVSPISVMTVSQPPMLPTNASQPPTPPMPSLNTSHHPPLPLNATHPPSMPIPPPPTMSPMLSPMMSPPTDAKSDGKGTGTTTGTTTGGTTGGTDSSGTVAGQLTCSSTQDYVGDPSLAGQGAALLGSVACVDQAAIEYRQGLDASIAGTDTSTVNVYGPFEAGFTNTVPGLSCLNSNVVDGGIDTYTAQLMVRHLCNDNTIELLQTCGDHANPRHFHEMLTNCLSYPDSVTGHSSRIGTAGDGLGVYGPFGKEGAAHQLDACGATVGVTPDSNGVAVRYYGVQQNPPFFLSCYTNAHANTTLAECEAMFSGCSSTPVSITTAYGTGNYKQWCPCWNSYGSNAGENSRPAFWEPLASPSPPPSSTPNPPPSPTPPSPPPPSPPPPLHAICINNYWPLYLTESEANAVSPIGSSHVHVFGSVSYYMPDSVVGALHNDGQCPVNSTFLSPSPPPSPLSPMPSPPPPPPSPLPYSPPPSSPPHPPPSPSPPPLTTPTLPPSPSPPPAPPPSPNSPPPLPSTPPPPLPPSPTPPPTPPTTPPPSPLPKPPPPPPPPSTSPSPPPPSSSSPPPVPSPHPPSPAPSTPPDQEGYVVSFTMTVAGDESSFDKAAYIRAVSNVTGVKESHISVTVTAASINVNTEVIAGTYTMASATEQALAPIAGNSSAASAALGVQVESISKVSVVTAQSPPPPLPPPSPPSPSPPSSPSSSTETDMVLVGVIVGASVLVLAGAGAAGFFMYRRMQAMKVITPKPAEPSISAPLLRFKSR